MSSDKAITLRLDAQLAEELDHIARIDKTSKNEVIRRALRAYVHSRRADADFQRRLREKIATAAALAKEIGDAAAPTDEPLPAPRLTRLMEALTDYLVDLGEQLPTIADSERPASRVMAEYVRVTDLFDFLEDEAPLCLWQDPNVDHSWKCQLWEGHRQPYHSCS